ELRPAAYRRRPAAAPPGRPGVVELPAQPLRTGPRRAARALPPEPAAEPGRPRGLHRHAGRPGRPAPRHRPDELRASGLYAGLGRRAAPPARAEHQRHRVRRRLPRLGFPRGRLPVRRRGGPGPRRHLVRARIYEVTISHARSAPLRNVFRYRSYLWLVALDHLPRVPWLARFRARDHLGDPQATIRVNLDRFLAARGVDLGGGRVTMLAHAAVLGYVFNPLTVYWCHRADG